MELKMSSGVMTFNDFLSKSDKMSTEEFIYKFGRIRINDTKKLSILELRDCLLQACVRLYDLQGLVDTKRISSYIKEPRESEVRAKVKDKLNKNRPDDQSVDYFVDMFLNLSAIFVSRLHGGKQILKELKSEIGNKDKSNTISYNINNFEKGDKISNEQIKDNLKKLEELIEKKIEAWLFAFSPKLYEAPGNQKTLNNIKNNIYKIIESLTKNVEKEKIIKSDEWKDVKSLVNSKEAFYIGDRMGEFATLGYFITEAGIAS